MIQLQHVSKHYKNTTAVDNISFEVTSGETVVLLGTSGCGKTTTLRMINRLAEPTSGEILVNGQNVRDQPAEKMRRGIGYVLQHHGLFPHYTVQENIAIVPKLLSWDEDKVRQRTGELLEKLQLPHSISGLFPAQLSGVQQQRVGLARALAAYPPVLLMDEPLGALDPLTRAGIRKEFKNLDELRQKTILMVTHDVQEAFELGDRICLMDKGKIVQIGKPIDLLFNPASDFVRSFIKEQHFLLGMQHIQLINVWSSLPKAIDGTDEKNILPENTIWQVLQTLSSSGSDSQRFICTNKYNAKRQIDTASLMAAYTQYKNTFTT